MRLLAKLSLLATAATLPLATLTTGALAGASSGATPTVETAVSGPVSSRTIGAAAYWTPERMATAIPIEPALGEPSSSPADISIGTPGRVDPTPALSSRTQSARSDRGQYGASAVRWKGSRFAPPASTSGKVFFVADDGLGYVCSGSTVNSNGKNVVFTAGHCVHGGGSGRSWFDASRWVFAPSYNAKKKRNPTPYGLWTASQLWSLNGWIDSGDRTFDIGAAVMQTDAWGTHIVNAVGGQGIEWNWPLEQYMYQFGYPQRAPFAGKMLQYCTGDTYNDGGHEGINCDMTEGASGGPWLDNFDGTFGYLDSVNSWVFWDAAGVRYKWNGPYFGDGAHNLYTAVADL